MPTGKILILTGLILAGAGLLIEFGFRLPFLGRLPGDIHIQRENFSLYFPFTSGLLVSILISLLLWIFRR